MLKDLCLLNGTSGDEVRVRDYIINEIKEYSTYKVDNLGSVIAYKKGKKKPNKTVCINAHMDTDCCNDRRDHKVQDKHRECSL